MTLKEADPQSADQLEGEPNPAPKGSRTGSSGAKSQPPETLALPELTTGPVRVPAELTTASLRLLFGGRESVVKWDSIPDLTVLTPDYLEGYHPPPDSRLISSSTRQPFNIILHRTAAVWTQDVDGSARCLGSPELYGAEPRSEPMCGLSDEPPLPGKIMGECSASGGEQPQYYTPVSTKLEAQLMSPGLDAHVKQGGVPEMPMCRICHDSGAQEELLSPCECSGTLAPIHRGCLERWLSASGTSFCELCHYQFTVQRKSRPLLEWLQNPGLRQEKRTLFGDMVCFLLITPLATISGWLCLRGAIDHLHFSSRLEAVGLIALTVALFTIYLFWTLVSLRYHSRLYNEWRRSNQRVVLLLARSHGEASAAPLSSRGSQRGKQPSKESVV
ncbi:LOW QUALITY PROTEIN: E3 ubiquitin-protein ligase MARCHF3-like [Anoplopoma fimbria]|uniref:LOW QUALITY PROTEIN: E3 ubiquitin-protein ligase MARCHF3-like n=1 Tax=Anoplopoma fimbria TaxID=229290 RepID=UPI0023EC7D75|nr:LOW QUALITY PROTEIN: E3 ubiquitin-protein ligase MARCHF3-like [Anoplopoma fimbria]